MADRLQIPHQTSSNRPAVTVALVQAAPNECRRGWKRVKPSTSQLEIGQWPGAFGRKCWASECSGMTFAWHMAGRKNNLFKTRRRGSNVRRFAGVCSCNGKDQGTYPGGLSLVAGRDNPSANFCRGVRGA